MQYSVVVPAYNAAATINDTLASVFAQSVPPAEVIVVDDGSSDETAAMVSSCMQPIILIKQDNSGCGAATSAGMRAAKYPIIATVDADDLWLPDKIAKQLEFFATHPHSQLVCTRLRLFQHGSTDYNSGTEHDGYIRSTLVLKRQVYDEIGDIIDPPGNRGDLVDWLARCRETGFAIGLLPEVLCLRRVIPGSLSYGRDGKKDRGYLDVVRRAMLRRRALTNTEMHK
jgi:glycosyltransferase involved in cell wall biosynthesis